MQLDIFPLGLFNDTGFASVGIGNDSPLKVFSIFLLVLLI